MNIAEIEHVKKVEAECARETSAWKERFVATFFGPPALGCAYCGGPHEISTCPVLVKRDADEKAAADKASESAHQALRDQFAMAALTGMLARTLNVSADSCYYYADFMLAAREKRT